MFLHLHEVFPVVGHIVDQRLTVSSADPVEELFESSWHLNLIIILKRLVQLVQDQGEAIFSLARLVHQVLDLSRSYSTEARHQVDGGFPGFLVEVRFLLVEQDPLPPFFVVTRAVREDRYVGVLHEVDAVGPQASCGSL